MCDGSVLLGLIVLAVTAVATWQARHQYTAKAFAVLAAICVVWLFAYMSYQRSKCYTGMPALWSAVLYGNPEPGKPKPVVPVHGRNPDTWQAQNHMGALLYAQKRMDEAMAHFRRGVELKPYNCEVHNNYALTLAAKNRMEEALVHYKKAVELKEDAQILSNYGHALMSVRRYAEAAEQLKKSVTVKPDNPMIWLSLGNCYLLLERPEEAIAAYGEALKLNPGYREAERNLARALELKQARSGQPSPP